MVLWALGASAPEPRTFFFFFFQPKDEISQGHRVNATDWVCDVSRHVTDKDRYGMTEGDVR